MIVKMRTSFSEPIDVGINPDDVPTVTIPFCDSVGEWDRSNTLVTMKNGEKHWIRGTVDEVLERLNDSRQ